MCQKEAVVAVLKDNIIIQCMAILTPFRAFLLQKGRPGYITLDRSSIFGGSDVRSVETMQQASNKVMDKLFSLTDSPWLDCARSYGLSEKFVGEYLRTKNIDMDAVYVSSKWGYSKHIIILSSLVLRRAGLLES